MDELSKLKDLAGKQISREEIDGAFAAIKKAIAQDFDPKTCKAIICSVVNDDGEGSTFVAGEGGALVDMMTALMNSFADQVEKMSVPDGATKH